MSEYTENLCQWALWYARRGYAVIPIEPNRKTPYKGFRWREQATSDWEQVLEWWTQAPESNIALACGEPSGIHVLDVDRKGGVDGWTCASRIVDPETTPFAHTPSGGFHFYYTYDPQLGNHKLRDLGLDIQGTGSYVLAPPSVVDGKPYVWGRELDCLNGAPVALRELVLQRNSGSVSTGVQGCPPVPEEWVEIEEIPEPWMLGIKLDKVREAQGEGDRSAALYSIALSLFNRIDNPARVLASLMTWAPEAAVDRRGSDAATWMWKYAVWPAKQQHDARQGMLRQIVYEGEGGNKPPGSSPLHTITPETTWAGLGYDPDTFEIIDGEDKLGGNKPPGSSPSPVHDLRAQLTQLQPGDNEEARAFLGQLVGLSELDREEMLQGLSSQLGLTLRVLRSEYKAIEKALRDAERATFGDEPGRPFDWGEYIYLQRPDAVWSRAEGGSMRREAFRASYGSERFDKAFPEDGNGCIPRLFDITYWPGQGERVWVDKRERLNIWTPGELQPAPGDPEPWLDIFRHSEYPAEEVEHMLDWFAYLLQHPDKKINHGLVLGGAPGVGKDTLLKPIRAALGAHNCSNPSADLLLTSFSDWAINKKLVIVQEVGWGGSKAAREIEHKLKPLLASGAGYLSVHPKGRPAYEVPDVVQVVMVTNERHPLHISLGDRRYFLSWAERQPYMQDRVAWARYWEDMHRWLDTGGNAIVYHYLLHRDVSGFQPGAPAPDTEWKREVVEAGRHELTPILAERIEHRQGLFSQDVLSLEEVQAALLGVTVYSRSVNQRDCVRALRELEDMGIVVKKTFKTERTTKRRFVIRNFEEWKNASLEDLEKYCS